VPRSEYAKRGFYDVWLPLLAPSPGLVAKAHRARDTRSWNAFLRRFRSEMGRPEPARVLDLLAALSHHANLSLGCYCEDESRCHRSVLRELLAKRGAALGP